RDADDAGGQADGDADQHGDATAIDQAGEVVAAELVGAEQVLRIAAGHPERHAETMRDVLDERVVRHQQRSEDGAECRRADDGCAEPGARIAPAPPHELRSRGSSTAFRMSASMVSPT